MIKKRRPQENETYLCHMRTENMGIIVPVSMGWEMSNFIMVIFPFSEGSSACFSVYVILLQPENQLSDNSSEPVWTKIPLSPSNMCACQKAARGLPYFLCLMWDSNTEKKLVGNLVFIWLVDSRALAGSVSNRHKDRGSATESDTFC